MYNHNHNLMYNHNHNLMYNHNHNHNLMYNHNHNHNLMAKQLKKVTPFHTKNKYSIGHKKD